MKKLKKGKVIATSLLILLVGFIVGIICLKNYDKYAGLVKVNNIQLSSISTKLSANISDLSEENEIYTKGYDEVVYKIKYRLSEVPGDRDVIINAKVDENDPYVSFKNVTGNNITSVLSSNGKEITITISNLPSNEEIESKLTMIIENAPKGYTVSPIVRIKESTESSYTNITVRPVTVNTNSVQGTVVDQDGNRVKGIIISLVKDGQIVKETYTNDEGMYTLSDITPDTYSIKVNEEIYKDLSVDNIYINDGNQLNLIVERVYPYKIETNKYITKVELNNLGASKSYTYNDVELAQIPVKRVDDLHGKIYYKIVVQNTGEKEGMISSVRDELPDGLSFDESLNSGYELKDGIIYNRNLEGMVLSAGEQITDTLVLTIDNTNIAKTYINKVNARGELYEHVVYLLNGSVYKTLDVLEGEKLDKVTVSNPNFKGWYTDETLTNLYNYDLPVEKDLILYGVTKANHTVIFNDKNPETLDVSEYDRQEVPNGEPATRPDPDPSHEGYDFCGWDMENGTHWDFNTPVTDNLVLTSCYEIKKFNVEFYDNSMNSGETFVLIDTIEKEYNSVLSNSEAPSVSWTGHNFIGWTTDEAGQNAYDFTTPIKGNKKLYAQYTLQDRLFIFNDENRITNKTVDYGSTVTPIASQGKEGHTFKYWSLSLTGTPFDFATKIYETTTVYAVYEKNQYDVIFNDVDPWTSTTTEYDRQRIPYEDFATEPTEPTKEGHTFCGWLLNNSPYDFNTPVRDSITLTSCYTRNKVRVTFMDGQNQYELKEIDYGTKVTDTDTHPSKEHYVFKYWSEDNTNAFDFDTIIKADKVLYSVYSEILPPQISHTPLYWTRNNVSVTITPDKPEYTNLYKIDDGTYQNYSAPFEVSSNGTIVAKSTYDSSESTLVSHEITNIDKLIPIIGTISITPTQRSLVVSGTVTDNESGIHLVNIYQDNVLVATINGTAINEEMRDYTKSKEINQVISGLTPNTEYSIKIEVIDGAGNSSNYTTTATTEQEAIVAQIISILGVPIADPADYIPFPTLEGAIEDSRCDTQCVIQMVDNTSESVSILSTQDITLDLNGKNVRGVQASHTIENNGKFTLIDTNSSEPGSITNTQGIAIMNVTGATLVLGEGSSEEPAQGETRVVDTQIPFVVGSTFGIYSENGAYFEFYDGLVRGTDAIQGIVTKSEYGYGTNVDPKTSYEDAYLTILASPVARINKSIYYGALGTAMNAANGGSVSGSTATNTFLSGFTHTDEKTADFYTNTGYTFVYDPVNDTLTSTNDYYGSMAFTETVVDLTNSQVNKNLRLCANITENTDGTKGTMNVRIDNLDENFNTPTWEQGRFLRQENNCGLYTLPAGGKYKVRITFTQPVQITDLEYELDDTTGNYKTIGIPTKSESELIITHADLEEDELVHTDVDKMENPQITMYGFYYDDVTDTIRSNVNFSTDYNNHTAFGYSEIDLTNKEGNYEIIVSASMYGLSGSTAGVFITEDNDPIGGYISSYDPAIYLYGGFSYYGQEDMDYIGYPSGTVAQGPHTATKTVQGGKKYYVKYYYSSNYYSNNSYTPAELQAYGINDELVINNIRVVKTTNSMPLDLTTALKGNAFDLDVTYPYQSQQNFYSLSKANRNDYYDSYIKIDLSESNKDKIFEFSAGLYTQNFSAIYITNNNRGLTEEEIKNNKDKLLIYDYDSLSGPYTYGSDDNTEGGGYPGGIKKLDYLLEKGNVYYIHFYSKVGFGNTSYAGEGYDCYTPITGDPNEYSRGSCGSAIANVKLKDVSEKVFSLGKYAINTGTVDVDSLAEESSTITQSDSDNIIIGQRKIHGFIYNSETDSYELDEPFSKGSGATVTIKLDLTSETAPQTYYYTTTYNGSYNSQNTFINRDEPLIFDYNFDYGYANPKNAGQYTRTTSSGQFMTFEPGYEYYITYYILTSNYSYPLNSSTVKLQKVNSTNQTTEYETANRLVSFNENVDEVQILTNISLDESEVVIDRGKDVILDLNGYKLSSSLSIPAIDNYGKLTIIDSEYENQTSDVKVHNGILESSAGRIIQNEENAELILKNFVMNVNGAHEGIYNDGKITFDENYDSKIYVNEVDATGIYNTQKGNVYISSPLLEIVMNYHADSDYTDTYYGDNLHSYLRKSQINKGFVNYGYVNLSNLRISGKNGTGFSNSGTAILITPQIAVDLNPGDKSARFDPIYTSGRSRDPYDYKYSTGNSYDSISDYSIYNGGNLTITNSGYVTYRLHNSGRLFTQNGASLDYIYSDYSGTVHLNGGTSFNNGYFSSNSIITSGSNYRDTVYNYGDMQISNTGTGTNTVLNNYNTVESNGAGIGRINNYENGSMLLVNGSSSHILNEGNQITLNNFSIYNSGDTEAIRNSGILNIENTATIKSTGDYGIYMVPIETEQRNISIRDRDNINRTYNKYTYKQIALNIGTDLNHEDNITIEGNIYGITGPCFKNAERKYAGNRVVDTRFIKYLDGTTEAITESNYNQDLCIINMYSGTIKSTAYPTYPSRAFDLPIHNTRDDVYTYWNNGLNVYSKDYAVANNLTATVAKIGSTSYVSLQDAVDSVPSGGSATIDLYSYTDIGSTVIPEGKTITLNLLDQYNYFVYSYEGAITNNGTLNITGSGQILDYGKYLVNNNGTLNVNGGTYNNDFGTADSKSERALVNNKGTANINGGTYYRMDMYNQKDLTINNGYFENTMIVGNGEDSVSSIKGGYLKDNSYNVPFYYAYLTSRTAKRENTDRHLFELSNGATGVFDEFNTGSDSRYTGGYFKSIGHLDNANLVFNNSTIDASGSNNGSYVSAENNSTVTFNDGTYSGLELNIDTSTINVNAGTINGYTNKNLIYLHGETPKANIISGELQSDSYAIGISDYDTASNQENDEYYSYKVIVGTKGDVDSENNIICSKISPSITGSRGIVKYGTGSGDGFVGFYDGILRGTSLATDVNISEIENDFELITETQGGYQVQYLDQIDLVQNITQNIAYKSFQQAFNAANTGDELVSLRDYINTSTTPAITIPAGKQFTMTLNHKVTINNTEFIINNGDVVFDGSGLIESNVTGSVFVNNGTLTINDLTLNNPKATDLANGNVLLNNAGATLNINGAKFSTYQHSIISNSGTLNIDKNVSGTSGCYNSTVIEMGYPNLTNVCDFVSPAIVNTGNANISNMVLQSGTFCNLINNSGNMVINKSTVDQSSNNYRVRIGQYVNGDTSRNVINNSGVLELNNSNFVFVPRSGVLYDDNHNIVFVFEDNESYIGSIGNNKNTKGVTINNSTFETSIKGLAKIDNSYMNISNSTLHTNSFGVMYEDDSNINFNNNTFNTRDSIIDGRRAISYGLFDYSVTVRYYNNSSLMNTNINIDGGTYTSKGTFKPNDANGGYGSYTPNAVTYNTTCESGSMAEVTTSSSSVNLSSGNGDFLPGYTNGITSLGNITIANATITSNGNSIPDPSNYNNWSYDVRYKIYDNSVDYRTDTKNEMATLTVFGTATINNSTISSEMDNYTAIKARGDNATIILGEKDSVYDNQKPHIYSTNKKTIDGPAKVKFYDGVIESNDIINVDSLFVDKEDNYSISGTKKKRYLVQDNIIQNVTKNREYTSIQDAINAASNGDQLKMLLPSVVIQGNNTVTINGKSLSLDLNANNVNSVIELTNSASLTINDSTNDKTAEVFVNVNDTSTLNIEDGSGVINAKNSSVVNVNNAGTLEINGYNTSTVNISGTMVTSNIYMNDSSILNANDVYDPYISWDQKGSVTLRGASKIVTTCTNNTTLNLSEIVNESSQKSTITCGTYREIRNGIKDADNSLIKLDISGGEVQDIYNYAELNITSVNVSSNLNDYGITNISNGTFNHISAKDATSTISGGTFGSDTGIAAINIVNSTITITGGTFNNSIGDAVNISGANNVVTITGGTFNSGIYNSKDSTLTIGTKDGNVSTTVPEINGNSRNHYGVNNKGTFKFYDGIIKGGTQTGAIVGLVGETETNYKISVEETDDIESAYLTEISSADAKIAVVNGINYRSLQQAINKSVLNCSSGSTCPKVTIYLNITLDADLTIRDGYAVDIVPGGNYTINPGTFNVPSTITFNGEPIVGNNNGGDIINGIRGLLGLNPNAKNVLIYEMGDGINLSTENHYRLYQYDNGEYKLVTMERGDEVARYTPGNGITNMKPIKGRLYLIDIEPGSYKVSDDNGSEVTFTISDDGQLSGHVKEYTPSDTVIESTGMAKLIISIQTGVRKVNYMLIAISLIAVLSVMFVIKRKNQNNKNLV